ncbi:MAG: hypothetical protein HYY30_04805 [Chloroflexi bacterium]|nr:hypothetical protein [Chloroflexota bacterium]
MVHSRLKGRFNVYNWLAAMATALTLGVKLDVIPSAVETMEPVRGRMQLVEYGQPFRVVVDFAHTPNALRLTLETLREDCRERLIAVIGHPGGRDRQSRPQLGGVAAQLCDFFVIAGDDPYDEEPESILVEIAAGARAAGAIEGRDFVRISDRRMAFAEAFEYARPGDTVLLAGRGHLSQWVSRGHKTPFDDALVAGSLLWSFR